MSKFIVTILTTDKNSTTVSNLKRLFPDSRYTVLIEECIPPANLVDTINYTALQQSETICVNKILTENNSNYPDSYSLIIKDTSVTVSTADQIYQLLNQVTQQAGWELFYLTKWLDRCDLYGIPQNVKNKTYTFINTFSPNGFQAIMFSPKGRDVILGKIPMKNGKLFPPVTQPIENQFNQNISNGNITAISTIPNLFEYDINQATTIADFQKGSMCSPNIGVTSTIAGTDQTPLSFIWYIIILIMIIVIIFAIWYLTGGNHEKKTDKEDFKG